MITAIFKAIGTALAHASIAALVAVGVVRMWPPPSQDIQLRQWAAKTDTRVDANFADLNTKIDSNFKDTQAIEGRVSRQQQAIDQISLTDYERMRQDNTKQQLSYFQAQLNAHESRLTKHDALLEANRVLIGLQRDRLDQALQPATTASVYWRY